jgi:hypothetical protein
MEPSDVVRALYKAIVKEQGKEGSEIVEMATYSGKWQVRELKNGVFVGLRDCNNNVGDYFLGLSSVSCSFWPVKPDEDLLYYAPFEVKARGFETGVWGYGVGKTMRETVQVLFSNRSFSAHSRILDTIKEVLMFLSATKIDEKEYSQKDINPNSDYTSPD